MANNNYEANLEWKNHSEFFFSLNKLLDEITETEALIYSNTKNIYKYFALISALCSKHICYLNDSKKISDKLKRIRDGLYDKEVLKLVEKKPNDPYLVAHLLKIYDGLTDVYRVLIEDFAKHELLPKVHKIDKNKPSAVRLMN